MRALRPAAVAAGGDEPEEAVGGEAPETPAPEGKKRRRRRRRKRKPPDEGPSAETRPAESRSAETRSADTRSADTRPADTRSADTRSADIDAAPEPVRREGRKESRRVSSKGKAPIHESRAPDDIVFDLPNRSSQTASDERKIALFCDLENIALGVRVRTPRSKSSISTSCSSVCWRKARLSSRRAYADWERYSDYKRAFHEAAVELIDIPQKRYSGKNSADIRMVVDAMDLCYSKEQPRHLRRTLRATATSRRSSRSSRRTTNTSSASGSATRRRRS